MVSQTNEEVFERIRQKRTVLNNILRIKFNWIGHILRINCLLHYVIQGQMTEVRGVGRRTQLLDWKNRRRYWKLKQEAEIEKYRNDNSSHKHKEEIQVIFHKSIDLLIISTLNNKTFIDTA